MVLYALTALLYGSLAVIAWRGRDICALPHAGAALRGMHLGRAVLGATLILHGVLLHMTIFLPDAMVFGFAFALSAMLWLSTGIYWLESFFFPLGGLGRLVLPGAAIAVLLPFLCGGKRVLPYAAEPLFKLHFVIANVAYGLFALVALHAVLMLCVERRLHAPRAARRENILSDWLGSLPPLLTLEKLLFRLIAAGFVWLTLTVLSGMVFSERMLNQVFRFDPKTAFAFLSWLMFGALLLGRKLYGWRGRAALRWVLAAFIVLLLTYTSSRFVFETLF